MCIELYNESTTVSYVLCYFNIRTIFACQHSSIFELANQHKHTSQPE